MYLPVTFLLLASDMGSENTRGCTQYTRNGFDFDFFGWYCKNDEFFHHIVQVTGDETWVSFVNVEAKEQSAVKTVDAHAFSKQAEKFKETSAYRDTGFSNFIHRPGF